MLKLEQVKIRPEQEHALLREKAAQILRIPAENILSCSILRKAERPCIWYIRWQ